MTEVLSRTKSLIRLANVVALTTWCERVRRELDQRFLSGEISFDVLSHLSNAACTLAIMAERGDFEPWGALEANEHFLNLLVSLGLSCD